MIPNSISSIWGTGNPAPWNPLNRKGDNLYTNSVLAIPPKTGKVVWHYQMAPGDPFDYDGVNELDAGRDSRSTARTAKSSCKRTATAIFYVIERATGKLVAANEFVKVNWADGIDMETGRPVWSAETKAVVEKGAGQRYASSRRWSGGKNWAPMSFIRLTRLALHQHRRFGHGLRAAAGRASGQSQARPAALRRELPGGLRRSDERGHLRAIDPLTGKAKWELPFKSPNMAGTLVTAGGLVFTGQFTGEFMAVDADTGKILWQFQTPAGIVGQPITWERDGKQYVTVDERDRRRLRAARWAIRTWPTFRPAGSLWTFKLFED